MFFTKRIRARWGFLRSIGIQASLAQNVLWQVSPKVADWNYFMREFSLGVNIKGFPFPYPNNTCMYLQ